MLTEFDVKSKLNLTPLLSTSGKSELSGNEFSSTGIVRVKPEKISLVTLGEPALLQATIPDYSTSLFVETDFDTQSNNPGNNFYFSADHDDFSLNFRITKDDLVFCNESISFPIRKDRPCQLNLLIGKNRIYAYFQNRLVLVKELPPEISSLKFLTFKLLQDSADLEAGINRISVSRVDQDPEQLNHDSLAGLSSRLQQLIKDRQFMEIVNLLKSFPILYPIVKENLTDLRTSFITHVKNTPGDMWIAFEMASFFEPEFIFNLEKELNAHLPPALVEVKDLAIKFNKNAHKRFALSNIFKKKSSINTYQALQSINFKAYPGDIIGILGANGAGKSTLLKAIAGLLDISAGEIIIRGHHILLSPGLGMRPELSGKENIYLASCYMGLTPKQTDKIYQDIVDFSELGEKIFEPYKYYSDGMKSRLVFSIATSIAPEILMLDEILGAGDIKFQKKAAKRMDELLTKSKLVLLVTHSVQIVEKKCNKALLISKGNQLFFGSPKEAVTRYLNELHMSSDQVTRAYDEKAGFLGELVDDKNG